MEVYRVDKQSMDRVPETELDNEAALENHLVKSAGAEIGDVELLYIGRQGSPEDGGIFDILAVDEKGNTVTVELKRGKAPREIVAQALEYASGIRKEDYGDLDERFRDFRREYWSGGSLSDEQRPLTEAHADHFGLDEPLSEREFNTDQRLLLVGTEFRDVSLNMADFLREHDIDVVCVEYDSYAVEDGGLELLVTDATRRPLSDEPEKTSKGSDSVDYSGFILDVRDRVFPRIKDRLELESREEVAKKTHERSMSVGSNHSRHPEPVLYSVIARIEERGEVKLTMGIWDADDDEHREIHSILNKNVNGLDGYNINEDVTASTQVVGKTMGISTINEQSAKKIASEYVSLIEFFHPRLVDEFGGKD
jgi:hypothetical protein